MKNQEEFCMAKVAVIVLNYNNYEDTIRCVESVLRSDFKDFQLIIVDNNSPNNSIDYLIKWAEGSLSIKVDESDKLKDLYYPFIPKPLPYVYYDLREIKLEDIKPNDQKNFIIFIQTEYNGGYAYGNNIAIKYALLNNDFDYIWILNNDTVVEKNSLSCLVKKAEYYKKTNRKIGLIGSKLMCYSEPEKINSVGIKYNKWFGISKHLGNMEEDLNQYDNEDVIKKIDYVSGASILLSRNFIENVGLMHESYFVYYEELDWVLRGKRKGWEFGYCWESKVYHKEGASIGSHSDSKKRSELAEYYLFRNRLLFTKKFYPRYLITVYLGIIIGIFNRIKRRQYRRVSLIWQAIKSQKKL